MQRCESLGIKKKKKKNLKLVLFLVNLFGVYQKTNMSGQQAIFSDL